MKAILLFGPTSMHSLPCFTTGQDFLHSCRHFFGLHFSAVMMAIRVSVCSSLLSLVGFFLGGMMMMAHEKTLVVRLVVATTTKTEWNSACDRAVRHCWSACRCVDELEELSVVLHESSYRLAEHNI